MKPKELEFLKERGQEFWENAQHLFEEEKYNLCVFNLEQACQLWLKYLIGKKLGDWPKTHYLEDLIKGFSKAYENKDILKYYQEKELFFENLSDAYFVSRYYPRKFTQNLAKQIISNCQEFLKLTEKISEERFLKK